MKTSNRQVAVHWGNGLRRGDVDGHGAMSATKRHGLCIGYSYNEPVAILAPDGDTYLFSLRTWSVTTAGHISSYRVNGPGVGYAASTETLHDVAAGRMSYEDALAIGKRARELAEAREHAAGVSFGHAIEPGHYRRGRLTIVKVKSNEWHVLRDLTDDERPEVMVTGCKTFREAKVASWPFVDHQPKGYWPTHEELAKAAELATA